MTAHPDEHIPQRGLEVMSAVVNHMKSAHSSVAGPRLSPAMHPVLARDKLSTARAAVAMLRVLALAAARGAAATAAPQIGRCTAATEAACTLRRGFTSSRCAAVCESSDSFAAQMPDLGLKTQEDAGRGRGGESAGGAAAYASGALQG